MLALFYGDRRDGTRRLGRAGQAGKDFIPPTKSFHRTGAHQ
jgi:hypothetical protein